MPMKFLALPPRQILKDWLSYDPSTGIFVWIKEPRRWRNLIGKNAGCKKGQYISIKIPEFGSFLAHRLAWVYVHGFIPDGAEIDHRDLIKSNNSISNLRLCDRFQQGQNRPAQSNNGSGLKGAYYHRPQKRWRSQIKVRGRLIFLGYYDTALQAHIAYCTAAREHFGEFARWAGIGEPRQPDGGPAR